MSSRSAALTARAAVGQREPEGLPTPARWRRSRGTGSRRPASRSAAPSSAALSRLSSPWAKRAPIDWTAPASSPFVGGSVTPPGTSSTAARASRRAPSSSPAALVAGATPSTPRRFGSERMSRRRPGRVVAVGQAVEHSGRALVRPSHGSEQKAAKAGTRDAPAPRRRLHQEPDLPVSRVIASATGVRRAPDPALVLRSRNPGRRAPEDPSPCRRSG